MKLGLGTVQFGMEYGVTNHTGQPAHREVAAILDRAAGCGVRVLDTACQYGASEETLGVLLPEQHAFRIVTKTPAFPGQTITRQDAEQLERVFLASLQKLRARSVHGLLIHSARDLLKPGAEHLIDTLIRLRESGKTHKIGVSVYEGAELEAILDRFAMDLVQTPVNILDQRWLDGSLPDRLQEAGIEVHARSIFLQGVLLADPDSLPAFFSRVRPHLHALGAAIRERGLTPLSAALGFVRGLPWVDVVLCGVVNLAQLDQILHALPDSCDSASWRAFAWRDEAILNPSRWVLT